MPGPIHLNTPWPPMTAGELGFALGKMMGEICDRDPAAWDEMRQAFARADSFDIWTSDVIEWEDDTGARGRLVRRCADIFSPGNGNTPTRRHIACYTHIDGGLRRDFVGYSMERP